MAALVAVLIGLLFNVLAAEEVNMRPAILVIVSKKLLPQYAYFQTKPFLIEDITMELLIFLDADVFTFLYGIDDSHNRVAHTIVSSTVCSVAQIQAKKELVKVGG